MRYAVSGSLLFHVGGAGVVFALMSFSPPPEKTHTDSVSVDLIATHSFSTNATEIMASDASVSLKAAGGAPVEAISAAEPPAIVKVAAAQKPQTLTKVQPVTRSQVAAISPLKVLSTQSASESADAVVPDTFQDIEPLQVAALAPVTPQTISASAAQEIPVPLPRITERPERIAKPTKPQKTKPPTKENRPQQSANRGGNDGQSKANARASKASAQSAAVANYPGRVLSKLRRSLRSPSGGRGGEAHVQFVVASSGTASSIRVVQSSGDAKIDAAAIATVRRAAPFPAIPADAGRRTWTFTIPLAFKR